MAHWKANVWERRSRAFTLKKALGDRSLRYNSHADDISIRELTL